MIDQIARIEHAAHALRHSTSVFPGDTDLTCTFTAAAGANTWSAWMEIVDSGATTLSAAFASSRGHLTEILIENISDDNTIYMMEISWGAAHNLLTTIRFAGGTKFQSPDMVARMWAKSIPEGETVYYRMKTATGVADTCLVHIRYHIH